MNNMKEWALSYADRGLAVFPLRPRDKRPMTENGCKNATTNRQQILSWWNNWPDANIGIATGSRSGGLVVIDLDVDEDKGINGYETLKAWQRENSELPETWQSITGRGGYHLIYRDSANNHNRVGLYEGIDIRGEGGYIVAPPSIHPNGKAYEWENGPGDCEIAPAEGSVVNFLLGPVPEGWDKQTFTTPEVIPDGKRNSTLYKLACSMRARGDAEEAIRAAVEATNNSRCVPPLDDKEINTLLKSSTKYKSGTAPYKAVCDGGKFRQQSTFTENDLSYQDSFAGFAGFAETDTTKLPLFNMELLPRSVKGFSESITDSIQVSSGMVAPAIVGIGALGVQKKYSVHPLPDWYEPGNLYTAIVAEPSERKSAVMKEIMRPVFEYEKAENELLAPKITMYETKKKILEGQIANLTKSAASNKKKSDDKYLDMGDLVTLQQDLNDLEEVNSLRLVVDDVTMEVLANVMSQNQERIGIVSTEGGIFSALAGRYSSNTVIDIVLKGYSGDPFSDDRITRKGTTLSHPLITIILFVQPKVIQDIMENSEFIGRGLNARFLYSVPPSTIGKRKYRVNKIPVFVRNEYYNVIQRLLAIPVPETPKVIELDEDADKMAEDFFNEIESIMIDEEPEYKAWLGKLHGTTMRIALIYHCFDYIEESEYYKISGDTMRRAIETGRYFQAHAKASFDIMGLNDPPEVKDAKYILKRIDSTGVMEIKLRDLHDICRDRKGMEKKEGMIPGLKCLIERGFIRVEKSYPTTQNPQNPQKGGRPSEIVYVNPEYIKWKENKENGNNDIR